ncbi:hypothetical protein GW17_00044951, partial [Ensete ventricosum]
RGLELFSDCGAWGIFGTVVKMMVDSGPSAKPGAATNVSSEKDRSGNGDYASGRWKRLNLMYFFDICSEDGRLACGYSSFRGKRASMEDYYDLKSAKIDGQSISLFGIFDGLRLLKIGLRIIISGHSITLYVLVAIPLSDDHKPNRSDERKRIEEAGGVVMWAGKSENEYLLLFLTKINAISALPKGYTSHINTECMFWILEQRSSCFFCYAMFLFCVPTFLRKSEVKLWYNLLVFCSDYTYISNSFGYIYIYLLTVHFLLLPILIDQDAVSIVRAEEEPDAAARKLTETAFSRGSADNITCIVVRFHHEKTKVDSPPPPPAATHG